MHWLEDQPGGLLSRCPACLSYLQADSSEDEGNAVASPLSRGAKGGAAKGGRELKRLQMWAWERRSLASSEEDEEEEASGALV